MNTSNEFFSPIFWEQGLFLQPQHFQLLQRFFQQINTKNSQLVQPYFYGFNNYVINEMQLNNGIFEMSEFSCLFPDGTWVNFPENAVLSSRRFSEIWANPEENLKVYIGISLEKNISNNNNTNNVYQTDINNSQNLLAVPENYRYIADYNPQKYADLLSDETPADVRTLKYNVRLYFGNEINTINISNKENFISTDNDNINNIDNNSNNKINDNNQNNISNSNIPNISNNSDNHQALIILPIAILKRDGERIILNKHFVPPMLSLQNADALKILLVTIRDTLLSRAKQLEEYKLVGNDITQNSNIGGGSGSVALYITLFSVLGAISRHVPILNSFLNTKAIHPWNIYLELCSIVGELSVFSADLSPLGETESGQDILPKYNHNDLYTCFNSASQIITRLVDSLVIGPEYSFVLALQTEGKYQGLRIAHLPANALSPRYSYWLLIRSQLVENSNNDDNLNLFNQIKRSGKLAPLESLTGILARALPGIRLIHSETPPVGVPRRKNTLYYQIEYNDNLWQEVLKQGEVAFSLPGQPDDLFVQIMVTEK